MIIEVTGDGDPGTGASLELGKLSPNFATIEN